MNITNLEKIRVISRCLGEIYGYIPENGKFFSSITRNALPGIVVISRRAGYVWNEYAEGVRRRLFELVNDVREGTYESGRVEFAGRRCCWNAGKGEYITDVDSCGNVGEFRHSDISSAVSCLFRGGDTLMRQRIEKFEAGNGGKGVT